MSNEQRQLTPDQHTAIHEHTRNLIVVAGAGSGKTFVLVERYLTLLDNNPTWPLNAVVAITFTKKAAQEMRDRVRKALEQRLNSSTTPASEAVWAARMAAMESARIDTIHGLCASILRANAAEVGIDPGFEVLDEVDARIILDNCIDDVLESVVHEGRTAVRLFTEYDAKIIRDTLLQRIAEDIPNLPENVMDHWQQLRESNASQMIMELRNNPTYVTTSQWRPENGWPIGNDKILDVWLACHPLIATLNTSKDSKTCLDTLEKLERAINLQGGKADIWGDKVTLEGAKASLKLLREMVRETLAFIGEPLGEIDRKAAEMLPLWVELIRQAQQTYRSRKQEEGLLDFNDLELLTRDLLVNNPTVRERYRGTEFKHLLVDEFQDTNSTQWEIVRGLAKIEQGGSLFVVGDPKQSIYQFRGADVSVFEQVKDQITESGGVDVPLAFSFRSHQSLVDGFNHLFGQILVREANSPARNYEVELGKLMEAKRLGAPSGEVPIEVVYLSKPETEDQLNAEGMRRWEAYELANQLKRIVEEEKRLIYDKEQRITRPLNYGDIAILYQSTSNILVYEDVFKTAQLPFVTIAGRGYYSRQEVWDLLNLLTALHNPGDNLALASALRSPLFGLSDDALLTLRLQRDPHNERTRLPLYEALSYLNNIAVHEQAHVDFARQSLGRLRAIVGRVSIADLLQAALDETGYLATLTGLPDGARRRENVEKLIHKALESRQVTLGAFSQYLRDLTAREVREGEALLDVKNSVALMTVHASKGLEYPLVVLVDIGWHRGSYGGDTVMVDPKFGLVCKVYDAVENKMISGYAHKQAERLQHLRDIAERKRLLYVAATRAQDYLLLSGVRQNRKDTWMSWIDLALEINEELTVGSRVIEQVWGKFRITVPERPPEDNRFNPTNLDTENGWTHPSVVALTPLPGDNQAPLIADLPINISSTVRHITSTQIADAGGASFDSTYRQRFRRSVLHDAPLMIEQIRLRSRHDVSQRIIGEMVHKVLGWWQFGEDHSDFDDRLDSYAWELGVVDEGQRKYAIQEAHELLDKIRKNQVYRWLTAAQQLYREIPFVYRTDKRIIHGVLDVLLQRPDGSWVILDYKTSHVKGYKRGADQKLLSNHALRYYLQVGVYAAAVQEQLGGIVPDTYIYYIRYGQFVRVDKHEWSDALNRLEATIGDLLIEQAD
ncbi:MAG: AAA family ATPase [Anaerolineaceae bacterium]|nr:AAA family ATPase [Anaerolineaceae bacterium]